MYENFDHTWRHYRFVKADELYDAVDENLYRAFSVKSERDLVRNMLLQNRGRKIVSENQRFPDDDTYICVSLEPTKSLLAQLLHALDLSEKHVEADRHSIDDAYLSARKAMAKLMEILTSENPSFSHIYDRASFEHRYGLAWVEQND